MKSDLRQLIQCIEREGYDVRAVSSNHYGVFRPDGTRVHHADLPNTPGHNAWIKVAVTTLKSVGVLPKDFNWRRRNEKRRAH